MARCRSILICLPLLIVLSVPAQAEDTCPMECLPSVTNDPVYSRFDKVPVCVHLNGFAVDQGASKAVFFPKVDEFGVLEVPRNSENPAIHIPTAIANSTDDSFHIGISTQKTTTETACPPHTKPWLSSDQKYIVPFYTVVIRIDGGRIVDMVWDEPGCANCDREETQCIGHICGIDKETGCTQCGFGEGVEAGCTNAKYECNLKIYVAWLGTDKDGVPMVSGGKVFSRFRQFSAFSVYQDLYDQASGLYADVEKKLE